MSSILNDTKKMLGITNEYDAFDQDIIMDVNSVLRVLNQIGVGNNLNITSANEDWTLFTDDSDYLSIIKPYVYLRVKKIFDPSYSSMNVAADSIIAEYEWRITVMHDEKTNPNHSEYTESESTNAYDTELSENSTNAVQNKTITANLNKKLDKIRYMSNDTIDDETYK